MIVHSSAGLLLGVWLAQAPASTGDTVPLYRVTFVGRTIQAINFRHPKEHTHIEFRGTPLMPAARGKADVDHQHGSLSIDAKLEGLDPATRFGSDFLTYVMWTITPEGRPVNAGELIVEGGRARLELSSELQAFGIFVTAEPYFAVTVPSDIVVLEARAKSDTAGEVEHVAARAELLERGAYVLPTEVGRGSALKLTKENRDLVQARHAIAIARRGGASVHAADPLAKAEQLLRDAEAEKEGSKEANMLARQAVQTAEDARQIALKRGEEERLARERAAAARREATARARTAQAEERASAAESQAAAEARAREEAERERQRAEAEKNQLRSQLLAQLNLILETRETTRGLLVNVPDVFFDSGRYTLQPAAREKLARLAGVLLPYPSLKLEIEGHADSTGTTEFNQQLSEQRAGAVAGYLTGQGLSSSSIVTRGFGEMRPVADNDTAQGRSLNRRVEIIVSGELLGQQVGALSAPPR